MLEGQNPQPSSMQVEHDQEIGPVADMYWAHEILVSTSMDFGSVLGWDFWAQKGIHKVPLQS